MERKYEFLNDWKRIAAKILLDHATSMIYSQEQWFRGAKWCFIQNVLMHLEKEPPLGPVDKSEFYSMLISFMDGLPTTEDPSTIQIRTDLQKKKNVLEGILKDLSNGTL
jgi:hypothetical protein